MESNLDKLTRITSSGKNERMHNIIFASYPDAIGRIINHTGLRVENPRNRLTERTLSSGERVDHTLGNPSVLVGVELQLGTSDTDHRNRIQPYRNELLKETKRRVLMALVANRIVPKHAKYLKESLGEDVVCLEFQFRGKVCTLRAVDSKDGKFLYYTGKSSRIVVSEKKATAILAEYAKSTKARKLSVAKAKSKENWAQRDAKILENARRYRAAGWTFYIYHTHNKVFAYHHGQAQKYVGRLAAFKGHMREFRLRR